MRRFWRIQNPTYRGAVVGLICALVCCFLNNLVVMRGAENWALDNCFVLRGQRHSSAEVVVVGIDEDSLRDLKKPLAFISPELGEVVRFLDAEGASAIGIDFFIPADAEDRPYFRPGADGDADQLGKAIAQTKKVVLPEWELGNEWLSPLFQWKAKNEIDPAWTDLGYVNLTTDNDTFFCVASNCGRKPPKMKPNHNLDLPCLASPARKTKTGLPPRNCCWMEMKSPLSPVAC